MTDRPTDTPKTLSDRLARVLGGLGAIEKTGRNDFHNYNYHSAEDIMSGLRGLLAKEQVAVTTEIIDHELDVDKSGKRVVRRAMVVLRVMFTHGDESLSSTGIGEGEDSGDKAFYKAQTGALKYALRHTFLVTDQESATHDAENDTPHEVLSRMVFTHLGRSVGLWIDCYTSKMQAPRFEDIPADKVTSMIRKLESLSDPRAWLEDTLDQEQAPAPAPAPQPAQDTGKYSALEALDAKLDAAKLDATAQKVLYARVLKISSASEGDVRAIVRKLSGLNAEQTHAWAMDLLTEGGHWHKGHRQWPQANKTWWTTVGDVFGTSDRKQMAKAYHDATCHRLGVLSFGELSPEQLDDEYDDLIELGVAKRRAKIEREIAAWQREVQG